MSDRTTGEPYVEPYRDAHDDHGSGFGVTLWANQRSQRLRFRVMTEMVFMTGKRVLDAGCSRGDFAAYLQEMGVGYERFIGVDAVEPVIAFAKGRDLPEAHFVAGDFVADGDLLGIESPQVIAISGSLNTMPDEVALSLLDKAWASAGETLVFNFLSDRAGQGAPTDLDPARRLPALQLLDWAFSHTSSVQFRQDYFGHGHDATIAMRKT